MSSVGGTTSGAEGAGQAALRQEMGEELLKVTCMAVGHGDALLVECVQRGTTSRILIDGGPAHHYPALRDTLLGVLGSDRHLELLVITHIDADHIDGALIMLQDEELGLTLGDVWFNGWPQLESPVAPDSFGARQGAYLEALLRDKPWNLAFDGAAVFAPDEGELPVRTAGGGVLTLLSPRPKGLRRLRAIWEAVLSEAGMRPGDTAEAERRLAERKVYAPRVPSADIFAARSFGSDTAVANGSSIAFVFEYRGARILFAGDAYAPVLADGLQRMAAARGVDRLAFDAVKLSHHGSMGNVSRELLALIDCPRFLVSTNGDYFRHPDPETIRLLGEEMNHPEIRFNYRAPATQPWADVARQESDGVTATFPPEALVLALP
jgi:beta-lactamase superfamily II metal-dependent hydrolase